MANWRTMRNFDTKAEAEAYKKQQERDGMTGLRIYMDRIKTGGQYAVMRKV